MKLQNKLKLSPAIARKAYTSFQKMAYRFVDMDAEGGGQDARVIEYAFAISKLVGMHKGKVLDVGCTDSGNILPLLLTSLGWDVYGIDNREYKFQHPNFHFSHCDIRKSPFPNRFFDYVCAISTVEHIGLKGRYGVTEDELSGDREAIAEIGRIIAPDGTLLMTIPFGIKRLVRPIERVYDTAMLDNLLSGWKRREERYYVQEKGLWLLRPQEVAEHEDYLKGGRANALFELTPLPQN
jgi:SAM-dependent methyltransferase